MDTLESNVHQVFVKLLDGKHRILNFDKPVISVSDIMRRVETLTSIPLRHQFLVRENSRVLRDQQLLNIAQFPNPETLRPDSKRSGRFPVVVHLLLRLRGGKGGFGSLLRGAATKAGQKKTNNFDACRDMNGRRLRHVNAEKRLEEWRAEAEERKLEKMAEEFLKKKSKENVKNGKGNGGDGTEKYVAKYREDSQRCMEEVERSVRESIAGIMGSKRKNLAEGSDIKSKKFKIWLGKRIMGDSDSEDLDEEDSDKEEEEEGEENEKSVVIDNGSHSDSSKEAEVSTGSVSDKKLSESIDQGSSESGSDEVDNVAEEPLNYVKSTDRCSEDNYENKKNQTPKILEENRGHDEVDTMDGQQQGISVAEEVVRSAEVKNDIAEPVHEEPISASADLQITESEKTLNFDDYHSPEELEVHGMEWLKSELQARGLKCGGTLKERAARLFLLKTTPLEKLPKKLFAKK